MYSGNNTSQIINNISGLRSSFNVNISMIIGTFMCYLVSAIIVVVNGLYIVCFYVNRRKDWFNQAKNIVSIATIDLVVGITSLFMLVVVSQKNVDSKLCIISHAMCLSSQVTASVNLFRICVIRLYTTTRQTPTGKQSSRSILLQTLICYGASFAALAIPLFAWSVPPSVIPACTWSHIFRDRRWLMDRYMLAVMSVPTASTTFLYIVLCLLFMKKRQQIQPRGGVETRTNSTQMHLFSVKIKTEEQQAVDNECVGARAGCSREDSSCRNDDPSLHVQERTQARRRMIIVFKVIGLVCLSINVAELPYLLLLSVNIYTYPYRIETHFSFLASIFLLTNSIVSPFIYALRMQPVKAAMKSMLRSIGTKCKVNPDQGRH